MRQAQASLQEAENRSATWKAEQKDLERERQKLADEAATAENRLYSGKVHNPRELTDLQDKMAELGKRRESLEEPLIEAMLEVEQAEADIDTRQQTLDRVLAQQASAMSSLTEEREGSLALLDRLRGEVDVQRSEIEPGNLQQYDALRRQPRGIAVTRLSRDGECTVCGVGLTTSLRQQARRGEMVTCPTCGRILYSD